MGKVVSFVGERYPTIKYHGSTYQESSHSILASFVATMGRNRQATMATRGKEGEMIMDDDDECVSPV